MGNLSSIVISMLLAQSAESILLAFVLYGFYRLYNRGYLLHWARSWLALCIYLLGGGFALLMSSILEPTNPLRIAVSTISLIAGYMQIAWLIYGAWEINYQKPVSEIIVKIGYALSILLAIVFELVALKAPAISEARHFHRSGIKSLIASIAFLIASYVLFKTRKLHHGIGQLLVSIGFVIYGLQHLHYFIIILIRYSFHKYYTYIAYFGYLDFIIQLVIGLGLVIWFLEEEHKRVLKTAEQLEILSFHDSVTELPNFKFFRQKLEIALIQAKQNLEKVAILFIDLDRFKKINESLGHSVGDKLLNAIANRLKNNLSFADLVARFGGDEFCAFITGIKHKNQIIEIVEKLRQAIRMPFIIHNHELYLTITVGISVYPQDGNEIESLIKNAAAAMTNARRKGFDAYEFFDSKMEIKALEQLETESNLYHALKNNEFLLYYQPIINLSTNEIEEMEGLLRWNHPEKGILLPRDFLFAAENSGLIDSLELWALKQICFQVKQWHKLNYTNIKASVNLCARPFQMPNLIDEIRKILKEVDLEPSYLQIEITETIAMQNAENTLNVFHELKKLGVKIAIDDFGTGYSSLSYLNYFPIDTLKIDQSFVQYLDSNPTNISILTAIIALSHSLNLTVVAEGVETIEQLNILKQYKCDKVQGFLYSKPKPASELMNLNLLMTQLNDKNLFNQDSKFS
jgi:diguanylate cyclase (GGDEF)-like protein